MNLLQSLFSLHFLNDGVRTGIVTLLPFVAKDLHLNFTQVGFLGSSQGFLASILAIPAGLLATRIGGYKIILFSLFLYSLGTLGIGLSPNIFILIITFYLTAGGFGMFHVIGYTLISRMSEKTNIGKNLGNFTAIGDIGRIVLPSIAIFLIPLIGWRFTYISIGFLGLIMYGIFMISQKKNIMVSKTNLDKKETHFQWIKQAVLLLKNKKFVLISLASVIDALAGNPIYIFLPFLLLHKGISVAMLGIFIGIYFAGSWVGKSTLGRAVDKFGNAKVFVVAEIFMALCLIILIFSFQPILLLAIAFLLGIFTRGTTPVVTTLFSEVVHKDHYEKVFAVSDMFMGITAAFAPTFMGIVADKLGITFVFYTASVLAIFAAFPILILLKYVSQQSVPTYSRNEISFREEHEEKK